jgi:predicted small metal-binding protein
MTKQTIACKDVVPGCPFEAEADSEDKLLEKVQVHARHAHGVEEVTPELLAKVKEAIRER